MLQLSTETNERARDTHVSRYVFKSIGRTEVNGLLTHRRIQVNR